MPRWLDRRGRRGRGRERRRSGNVPGRLRRRAEGVQRQRLAGDVAQRCPHQPRAKAATVSPLAAGGPAGRRSSARLPPTSGVSNGPATQVEQRIDVATMLDSLPPEYREVIVLREWQQMSYAEMASVLGVPERTAETRLDAGPADAPPAVWRVTSESVFTGGGSDRLH